jgi:hypothetical protein
LNRQGAKTPSEEQAEIAVLGAAAQSAKRATQNPFIESKHRVALFMLEVQP